MSAFSSWPISKRWRVAGLAYSPRDFESQCSQVFAIWSTDAAGNLRTETPEAMGAGAMRVITEFRGVYFGGALPPGV
jgi:hypothetical protein